MKKILFSSFLILSTLGATLQAAPADDAAVFKAAMEQVDANGEMLHFQNNRGVEKIFYQHIPDLLNVFLKDQQAAPTIKSAYSSFLNLINIKAFKAVASSSLEIAPDFYISKSFILFDKQQKSILIDPTLTNKPLDWKNYPADTVIAIKGKINFEHAWLMIAEELMNSPDPTIKGIYYQIQSLKSIGFDIEAIMRSLDGELELLVTMSDGNFAIKLTMPDKNNTLASILKKFLPMSDSSNQSMRVPIPGTSETFSALYLPGKIVLSSNEQLMKKSSATLGDLPEFKKFAAKMPADGNGVIIINVSQNLLKLAANAVQSYPEAAQFIKKIQPIALLGISTSESNGEKCVIASNFSIPQYVQHYTLMTLTIPLYSALQAAQERARVIDCINNMKVISTGCFMYANEKNDVLPKSVDELVMKKLVPTEAAANVILLAPGVNISSVANPATYPLAICDRFKHKHDKVCVAFVDGHVESLTVPTEADEKDIIAILNNTYKYPQAVLDALLKAVSIPEGK